MAFPEGFQQGFVTGLAWVEYNLDHFVMSGPAGAYLFVSGVLGESACVSNCRGPDAGVQLPEFSLRAPETTHSEHCCFKAFGCRGFEWIAGYKMRLGCRDRSAGAREGGFGGRHRLFLFGKQHHLVDCLSGLVVAFRLLRVNFTELDIVLLLGLRSWLGVTLSGTRCEDRRFGFATRLVRG